jgi:hypothetical protein
MSNNQEQQQQQTTLFSSRVSDKPFWIWNIEEHKSADIITNGECCFNHIIGLPKKNTQDKPFFDYEKLLFDTLQRHQSYRSWYYRVYVTVYGINLPARCASLQAQ